MLFKSCEFLSLFLMAARADVRHRGPCGNAVAGAQPGAAPLSSRAVLGAGGMVAGC